MIRRAAKEQRVDPEIIQKGIQSHMRFTHMLDLEGVKVWYPAGGTRWKFRAITVDLPKRCPSCHKGMHFLKYGQKDIRFDDYPIGGRPVRVRLIRQRYKCIECKHLFIEPLEFLDYDRRATRRLVEAIALASLHRPFLHLAEEFGVHERSVRRVAHPFFKALDAVAHLPTPQWLGIDEVKVHGIPRTVLTNLKEKRIYDILPDTKEHTIRTFLNAMPGREEVEVVCMDLCTSYRTIVREVLPDAAVVADKYHLIQLGTKAVDQVRRAVKRQRRAKLKYDTRIVRKRRHNLTPSDKEALDYWKAKVPKLATAYELKEDFCEIWDAPNKTRGRALYQAWRKTSLKLAPEAFRPRINKIQQWNQEVFNCLSWPITNGYTERINGLAKHLYRTTRRLAFEALRAKLLYVYGYGRPLPSPTLEAKDEWKDPPSGVGPEDECTSDAPSPPTNTLEDLAERYLGGKEWDESVRGRTLRRAETPEDAKLMEEATRADPYYEKQRQQLGDAA